MQKGHVQQPHDQNRQQSISNARTPPIQRRQHDGQKLHSDGQSECDGGKASPASLQRCSREQQQQDSEDVNVPALSHARDQQRIPGIHEDPMFPCPRRRSSASNNRAIATSHAAKATLNAKIDSWIAVTARKKS